MVPIDSAGVVLYFIFIDPIVASVTDLELFDIKFIFQRTNGENWFHFQFGGHALADYQQNNK